MPLINANINSSGLGSGSAGAQAGRTRVMAEQKKREGFLKSYQDQKSQIATTLSTIYKGIQDKHLVNKNKIKSFKFAEGEDRSTEMLNALEANRQKELAKFEDLKQSQIQSFSDSVHAPLMALGIIPNNQAGIDRQAFNQIGRGLDAEEQAYIDALPKTEETRQGFDVAPKDETAANVKRLVDSKAITAKEGDEILKKRNVKLTTVVGRTAFDKSFGKKEPEDARKRLIQSSEIISRGSNLLRKLNKLGPGVVGFRAKLGEAISGTLGQFNPQAAESINNALGITTVEERRAFIVEAKTFASQFIDVVTREEGARVTDTELKLTKEVAGLDVAIASEDQARQAIQSLMALKELSADSDKFIAGATFKNDLSTDEGLDEEIANLIKKGYDNETIANLIRLKRQHRQQLSILKSQGAFDVK